jgi:hypothetical protein
MESPTNRHHHPNAVASVPLRYPIDRPREDLNKRRAFARRDAMLEILSLDKTPAELVPDGAPTLLSGDLFINLTRLELGVRIAREPMIPNGRVVARKSVQEATWAKLLVVLHANPAQR